MLVPKQDIVCFLSRTMCGSQTTKFPTAEISDLDVVVHKIDRNDLFPLFKNFRTDVCSSYQRTFARSERTPEGTKVDSYVSIYVRSV